MGDLSGFQAQADTYLLQADYFAGRLDTKAFRARNPHHPVLSANPLVIEPERGRYACLEKFGAVVFWNCPEPLLRSLKQEILALPGVGPRVEHAHDQLEVRLGKEDRVEFSTVVLRELRLEHLKIVSLALAQSVALDHFEAAVSGAMARVEPVVRTLREEGRLGAPHREVVRTVGFALDVRAAVLEHLILFDDPPETWESETLSKLHAALYDLFDLEARLSTLHRKLAYLQDANATFLELLTTRKNQRLEWIIILLIAFEILMALGKEALPRLR